MEVKEEKKRHIAIKKVFTVIEWGIVALLLVTILFTFKELVLLLIEEIKNDNLINHYKALLSDILLLAVGVEIAFLIIKKDIYFVIDILILAVARKLITLESTMDMLICVICIMILVVAKWFKKKHVSS